jgi:FSR family fosmidomycin resistance protein-like MFS transporter
MATGKAATLPASPSAPTTSPQTIPTFNKRTIFLITAAHFFHDMYPAFLAPLIPFLTDKFALSLFLAGFLQPAQRLFSLSQPVIGYYADRTSVRLFLVITPITTALVTCSLGIAPNAFVVVLLLLASGLSSAMFHSPAIATVATAAGRRSGLGMSIFMNGGDFGRSIGPIVVVFLLNHFGLHGTALAFIPALAIGIVTFFGLAPIRLQSKPRTRRDLFGALRTQGPALRRLISVVMIRGVVLNSFALFIVAYLKQRGDALTYAGIATSAFFFAGVVGGFVGGTLSDHVGRKPIILASTSLSAFPLFLFTVLRGVPSIVALAFAGLLLLCTGPVTLAAMQELLPNDRATGAGLAITAEYTVSALSTILVGLIADHVGLPHVIQALTLIPLLGIPLAMMLPETREFETA